MTLLLMEGFDHYTNYTRKGWQGIGPSGTNPVDLTAVSTPGRIGVGQAMLIGVRSTGSIGAFTTERSIFKLFPTGGVTEAIFGFALYTDANVPVTQNWGICFIDVSANVIARFYLTTTTLFPSIYQGTANVSSLATHTHGVWTYYEMRVKVAGAAGECELYRNGAPDIATTAMDFGTTPIAGVLFQTHAGGQNVSRYYYVDDLYVVSSVGAAPRNTFLGDVRVETLYPEADGAHKDWARSAGATNFSLVDEHDPNDDTDYVTSNVPGDTDTYVCSDLLSPGVVYGVQANMVARKTTAGFKQIRPVIRKGGGDYPGAVKTMAAAYNWYGDIYEVDPADSSEWTNAKVNAAEYGIRVVT